MEKISLQVKRNLVILWHGKVKGYPPLKSSMTIWNMIGLNVILFDRLFNRSFYEHRNYGFFVCRILSRRIK
ncbi:hypothetical protein BSK64_24485 [Paenibacillus odorifer]|nr:hypothetical protein BSK64_24485 [Paenibacillus odorifer]